LRQWNAKCKHLAALDQLGRSYDVFWRDVIERADLVVLAPAPPIGQSPERLVDGLP
jgi:hypothetical protein